MRPLAFLNDLHPFFIFLGVIAIFAFSWALEWSLDWRDRPKAEAPPSVTPSEPAAPFSPFSAADARLSANARHAYETYLLAFWREGNDMSVGETRRAIRALYGDAVDSELEQYFADRRDAILPTRLCSGKTSS